MYADDTELRRLVTAALGTGLMRCPDTIEAAAAYVTTGDGYCEEEACDGSHNLDAAVNDLLWGRDMKPVNSVFESALEELSGIFPKP